MFRFLSRQDHNRSGKHHPPEAQETLDQIGARILERRTEMTPRRLTRLQGSPQGYGGQNSLCGPDLLLRSTRDLCDWPNP